MQIKIICSLYRGSLLDCVKTSRSHFTQFCFNKCDRKTTFHIFYFKESPHIEDIHALYKYRASALAYEEVNYFESSCKFD